jgi:hypothetical protein
MLPLGCCRCTSRHAATAALPAAQLPLLMPCSLSFASVWQTILLLLIIFCPLVLDTYHRIQLNNIGYSNGKNDTYSSVSDIKK